MHTKNNYQRGYGGIEAFLVAMVIGVIIFVVFYPIKFAKHIPNEGSEEGIYCRDIIDDPSAPTVTAPSYDSAGIQLGTTRTYRMIKQNVSMNKSLYIDTRGEHFYTNFKEKYENPQTREKFVMRIPKGEQGRSYKLPAEGMGNENSLTFAEYGLLYLFHADDTYEPIVDDKFDIGGGNFLSLVFADIYKAVDTPPLPEWVTKCIDAGTNGVTEGVVYKQQTLYYPDPKKNFSPFKKEEQLGWFLPRKYTFLHQAWWTPHCKPAIYLYPEKKMQVNVQVEIPHGEFLYTDPMYPKGGWKVVAHPSGKIEYIGKNLTDSKGVVNYGDGVFPYLYYEGKIADSVVEKPTKGFVIAYNQHSSFFDELLPKLGLNQKESQEFKDYWLKALPKASYYFIGIIPKSNLDEIEPLTVTPQQDTTIRVTLYFEALSEFKVVTPPAVTTPTRSGFTVVEWGGMLKTDKEDPFTCLQ
jgi:hypothetical protein